MNEEELILTNISKVKRIIAWAQFNYPNIKDEIESIAYFKLFMTARKYDKTKNPEFFKVAQKYIWWGIKDCIEKDIRSEELPIKVFDKEIANDSDFYDMIEPLKDIQKTILKLRYIKGYTIPEMSEELQMSEPRIKRLHKMALITLLERYTNAS